MFTARYAKSSYIKHIKHLKNKCKEKMGGRGLIYLGQNTNKWRALVNAKLLGFIKYLEFDLMQLYLLVKVAISRS